MEVRIVENGDWGGQNNDYPDERKKNYVSISQTLLIDEADPASGMNLGEVIWRLF